jgi:hypothetical protein
VVLLSGPYHYMFRYYTRDGRELPLWQNQTELPARVRLTILDNRGAVIAAPIEIPTFASLAAGCLVATNLSGCPIQPKEDPNEWMKQYGLTPSDK